MKGQPSKGTMTVLKGDAHLALSLTEIICDRQFGERRLYFAPKMTECLLQTTCIQQPVCRNPCETRIQKPMCRSCAGAV